MKSWVWIISSPTTEPTAQAITTGHGFSNFSLIVSCSASATAITPIVISVENGRCATRPRNRAA